MTESDGRISRRELLERGALGGLGIAGLAALAGVSSTEVEDAFAAWAAKSGISTKLIAAAKKDGHLNVITLPTDWADYGEIMNTYQSRWKIGITDDNPLGTSAEEIKAIQDLKGQSRAPDVVDVSLTFADVGKKGGLFSPYKVATWSSIPKSMKDPGGAWVGDYWGAQSFLSVGSVVKNPPKDWSDLTKPEYKGQVAIDNDPRQAGDAFGAVMAAALANGGSLDNIAPGIDFFAKLKQLGNWNPTIAHEVQIERGETPIAIRWDYLNLATRDTMASKGLKATVTIPTHGVYGGYYCQAISKFAPHPNAAKLWMEFIYSDEGQLFFLKGYTHPARFADLAKRKKVPKSLASKLPKASLYKPVKFASLAQITKANVVLNQQWGPKMGA